MDLYQIIAIAAGPRLRAYVGLQDAIGPIPIERQLSRLLNITSL